MTRSSFTRWWHPHRKSWIKIQIICDAFAVKFWYRKYVNWYQCNHKDHLKLLLTNISSHFTFLRERSWIKRVRGRPRALLEMTRLVMSVPARTLLNYTRPSCDATLIPQPSSNLTCILVPTTHLLSFVPASPMVAMPTRFCRLTRTNIQTAAKIVATTNVSIITFHLCCGTHTHYTDRQLWWPPRSKVKVISSRRLYVSSLPLLNSENKMLYLCRYRRAGPYRVGWTRRPHFLF